VTDVFHPGAWGDPRSRRAITDIYRLRGATRPDGL